MNTRQANQIGLVTVILLLWCSIWVIIGIALIDAFDTHRFSKSISVQPLKPPPAQKSLKLEQIQQKLFDDTLCENHYRWRYTTNISCA